MNAETLAELHNAIRHLVTAVANAGLYRPDHPQVQRLCIAARNCFAYLLRERQMLSLMMVEGEILFDNFPLSQGLHEQKLAQLLERRQINRLLVRQGVDAAELVELVVFLARKNLPQTPLPQGRHLAFETLAESAVPPQASGVNYGNPGEVDTRLATLKEMSRHRLAEMFAGFARQKTIRVAGFIQAFSREVPALLSLMPIRAMDEYTFTHGLNVCLLNLAQAMNLGIQGQLLHDIGIAALLHDIGKLSVPLDILSKPGKLDDREWDIMRQHPAQGARRLLNSPGVPQLAVVAAFEHHMRYDFSGYPVVHNRWRQHLCSQMTTIADIYDALRTKRPYQAAKPAAQCAAMLQGMAGSTVHPQLTANFLQLLDAAMGAPPQAV